MAGGRGEGSRAARVSVADRARDVSHVENNKKSGEKAAFELVIIKRFFSSPVTLKNGSVIAVALLPTFKVMCVQTGMSGIHPCDVTNT